MSKDRIVIRRTTAESAIEATLSRGERDPEYKKKINTSIQFLNHMIEHIMWRSCMNITAVVDIDGYRLTHVISEDVGMSIGEAFLELFNREIASGVNGAGTGISIIDEAQAQVVISFEERAMLIIDPALTSGPELVEDMQSADLVTFFEGFVQGAKATVHIDLKRGTNPHHVWEAVFRAFGAALRTSFAPCEWRKGTTPGVKGVVSLEKE